MDRTTMTINEYAAKRGVSWRTVAGWIRSGELRASDGGTKRTKWLIEIDDAKAFESARSNVVPTKTEKKPRATRRRFPDLLRFYG